jgi:hypothetical protein
VAVEAGEDEGAVAAAGGVEDMTATVIVGKGLRVWDRGGCIECVPPTLM